MNQEYIIRWKRYAWMWYSSRKVIGHKVDERFDFLVLTLPDGGVKVIPRYSKLFLRLKIDWVLAKQAEMSQKAGQQIPLNMRKS